jgi:hypothetical protein
LSHFPEQNGKLAGGSYTDTETEKEWRIEYEKALASNPCVDLSRMPAAEIN